MMSSSEAASLHSAPDQRRASRTARRAAAISRITRNWQLYVLLIIPVVWLLVFRYWPMYGAQIAFRDYTPIGGVSGSEWVGFENFERFFHSPKFEPVIVNTLVLSFYTLIAGFPLPIMLALSLNYVRLKMFLNAVQMITYAPHFISTVVLVGMLFQFLHPRVGFTAVIATTFGLDPPNWMGDPDAFRHVFVWSGVWQNLGFSSIIYLAVLATIDPALHEAAVVDGANKLQRMWHIDLPGLMPTAIVLLVLDTGRVLDVAFEKVLLMQNPLNIGVAEVVNTYVYRVGLASPIADFSFATAIGLLKGIVGLILMISVNRVAKRVTGHGIW